MRTTKQFLSSYHHDREHDARVKRKRERLDGLLALQATHEERGDLAEVKRLATKIRLVRQELTYMER